jgi:transcriptional regulator with XRE-family HTH domain
MAGAPQEAAARARELQRSWYGEPLGDLFRRLIAELGLNQARLAGVLGLSAPMLSQLMSGQRAKIGNPAVVQRLQALQELAGQLADGRTTQSEAAERMRAIRQSEGSSVLSPTTGIASAVPVPHAPGVTREIRSLLRAMASADEIVEAADILAPTHPHLAEFLRVYGAGRTDDAVAHYESYKD